MDKRLDFEGINPDIRLDQILIDSAANRPALHAVLTPYAVGDNPNFRITAEIDAEAIGIGSAWSTTGGYIFLNGEILQVDAQSGTFNSEDQKLIYDKETTYDPKGDITYGDGTPRQTWQVNRGVISVVDNSTPTAATQLNGLTGDGLSDKIEDYIDLYKATDGLQTKVITVRGWDMTTVIEKSVNHGLTLSSIRSVVVTIKNDDGSLLVDLFTSSDGSYILNSTELLLYVNSGGFFDNSFYSDGSASKVRGYATIQYEI